MAVEAESRGIEEIGGRRSAVSDEIEHILGLIDRARLAWDQYNIQLSLPPTDTPFLVQGHPWDAYNNGRHRPQARRDPAAVGAAWNRLQGSLVELSDTASRVRGRLALAPVSAPANSIRRSPCRGLQPRMVHREPAADIAGSTFPDGPPATWGSGPRRLTRPVPA